MSIRGPRAASAPIANYDVGVASIYPSPFNASLTGLAPALDHHYKHLGPETTDRT